MRIRFCLLCASFMLSLCFIACGDVWWSIFGCADGQDQRCSAPPSSTSGGGDGTSTSTQETIISGCLIKDHAICLNTNFSGQNLSGARLNNSTLSGSNFAGADLQRMQAVNATVDGSVFANANLTEANFEGAKLQKVTLNKSILTRTNFKNVDFAQSVLDGVSADAINMNGATLNEASLIQSKIGSAGTQSDFSGLKAFRANFSGTTFTNVNFQRSDMRCAAFNNGSFTNVDFKGADLRGAIIGKDDRASRVEIGSNLDEAILCDTTVNGQRRSPTGCTPVNCQN